MSDLPPPYSIEGEIGILGSAILDPSVAPACAWLEPKMFYRTRHRTIWRAIKQCLRECRPTDSINVIDMLERLNGDKPDGFDEEINTIVDQTPTSAHAESYARIVLEKYQLRSLLRLADVITKQAYGQDSPSKIGTEAMRNLGHVLDISPFHRSASMTFAQLADQLSDDVIHRKDNPHTVIKSGFVDLDRIIGGFEGGTYGLVAARPGAGKTAFVTTLAQRLAARFQRYGLGTVEFFSMEMSIISLARRIIASQSIPAIEIKQMRAGFTEDEIFDAEAYANFFEYLEERKRTLGDALVFHEGAMTTDEMSLRIMEAKATRNARIILVDQIDKFLDRSRDGNLTTKIAEISGRLSQMAVRHQVTILAINQLNRSFTDRADKRPELTDLKQSGNLEQDAEMVFGLYRPSYFFNGPNDEEEYTEWAELEVLKNRDGQLGVVPLCFKGKQVTFFDWDRERYPIEYMQALVERKEHGK